MVFGLQGLRSSGQAMVTVAMFCRSRVQDTTLSLYGGGWSGGLTGDFYLVLRP